MIAMSAAIAPIPGMAWMIASAMRRSWGSRLTSRSTRSTRRARSTASGPDERMSAIATTRKSNTFQPSRQNARPSENIFAASSMMKFCTPGCSTNSPMRRRTPVAWGLGCQGSGGEAVRIR